jgi:hypothetical protein
VEAVSPEPPQAVSNTVALQHASRDTRMAGTKVTNFFMRNDPD